MNKLLATLVAALFALVSFGALADDKTPETNPKAPTKAERAMKKQERMDKAAMSDQKMKGEMKSEKKARNKMKQKDIDETTKKENAKP